MGLLFIAFLGYSINVRYRNYKVTNQKRGKYNCIYGRRNGEKTRVWIGNLMRMQAAQEIDQKIKTSIALTSWWL